MRLELPCERDPAPTHKPRTEEAAAPRQAREDDPQNLDRKRGEGRCALRLMAARGSCMGSTYALFDEGGEEGHGLAALCCK